MGLLGTAGVQEVREQRVRTSRRPALGLPVTRAMVPLPACLSFRAPDGHVADTHLLEDRGLPGVCLPTSGGSTVSTSPALLPGF